MNRDDYLKMIKANEGVLIFKFTATWCAPCNAIKSQVAKEVAVLPPHIKFVEIDVDKHVDVYACMRSKKQVIGIPALLAYKRGNDTLYADYCVTGSNPLHISQFFQKVQEKK
jgi:thiol-disulfide isomerase/thioredoxin